MRVLLTGFEPFDGRNTNASEQIARAVAADPPEGIELHVAILPVTDAEGPATVLHAIEQVQPDAVISMGEAAGYDAMHLERFGHNLRDYRIPDNAGVQIRDEPIEPDGPSAYDARLPLRAIEAAITQIGIPAQVTRDAGAFLCNQVLYTLLHHAATRRPDLLAGFIHVPLLTEQLRDGETTPTLSLKDSVAAIRAALRTLLP